MHLLLQSLKTDAAAHGVNLLILLDQDLVLLAPCRNRLKNFLANLGRETPGEWSLATIHVCKTLPEASKCASSYARVGTPEAERNLLDQRVLVRNDAAGLDNGGLGLVNDRIGSLGRVGDEDGFQDVNGHDAAEEREEGNEDGERLHVGGVAAVDRRICRRWLSRLCWFGNER